MPINRRFQKNEIQGNCEPVMLYVCISERMTVRLCKSALDTDSTMNDQDHIYALLEADVMFCIDGVEVVNWAST